MFAIRASTWSSVGVNAMPDALELRPRCSGQFWAAVLAAQAGLNSRRAGITRFYTRAAWAQKMRKSRAATIRSGRDSDLPSDQGSEWSGFLERGKADLEACKRADAQLSAYLAQQAVEKHAKALILKCGIGSKPGRVGHFVLRGMIDELVKRQEKLECEIARDMRLSIQQLKTNWEDLSSKLQELENGSKLKEMVFKESLQIDHNDAEQKAVNEYRGGFVIPANLGVSSMLDTFRDAVASQIDASKGRASLADPGEARCVALAAIMAASVSIVSLFPHETYGRYPIAVGDERAAQVYRSRRKELADLIAQAEKDCELLEKVVLAVPDMSQSSGSVRAGGNSP